MKKIFLFSIIIVLFSCKENKFVSGDFVFNTYDEYVIHRLNELSPPIVLIEKQGYVISYDTVYSVIIKDSHGKLDYYKYNSEISCLIGSSYEINDTIF